MSAITSKAKMASAVLAAALLGLSAASAHAAVAPTDTTYDFVGQCADCASIGTAELVLSNYTVGDAITTNNFVSFHYDGTNLQEAFTITNAQADQAFGDLSTVPGENDFTVYGNGEYFNSSSSGYWCVGGACLADYGFSHVWSLAGATPVSAAPEPGVWALMLAGLAFVGGALRVGRRRPLSLA